MNIEKFEQPLSAIEVVSTGSSDTYLTPEALAQGRARVAAGEDLDAVALDLAIQEVVMLAVIEEQQGIARTLGGAGSGFHGHAGRPGKVGGSATAGFVPATAEQRKALGLPPAWTNVKINPDPNGALRAIGTDKKGRTQYRYAKAHSEQSAAEKFERLKAFHAALPELRDRIEEDLASSDVDTREAAELLHLVDATAFRIGSDQDTLADVKAFGASTLEAKHVKIAGDRVTFKFIGKKGVPISKTVEDRALATILKPRVAAGGRLFKPGADMKVREYLKTRAPGFTPKDFRTWHATAQAFDLVRRMDAPETKKAFKASRKRIGEAVAASLGNTSTVALASYISPTVFARWEAGL